jgi:hypothetical protein
VVDFWGLEQQFVQVRQTGGQSLNLPQTSNLTLDALLELVCVELQLTESQDQLARSHYAAVSNWLSRDGSSLHRFGPHVFPQGSQRIGTTTKPLGKSEFDLDAICKLTASASWHPGILYQMIWDRLCESAVYRPMMKRMPRCIRLEYAGNFHLDIAPAIPDAKCGGNCILVPDLHADLALVHPGNNRWKSTNPQGYASWFEDRCVPVWNLSERYHQPQVDPVPEKEAVHAKPTLKRSVQLFKRWRDVTYSKRPHMSPPSIILTTLSGLFYEGQQLCSSALHSILSATVRSIESEKCIRLTNPSHSSDNICEKWDKNPDAFMDFCSAVVQFLERWEQLLKLRGLPAIEKELSDLFGQAVVRSAIKRLANGSVGWSRQNGNLQVQTRSGMLLASSSTEPSVRVPHNRFYGDKD